MVEHNLDLLSSLKQARRDLFLASSRESPNNQEEDLILEPEDVNDILQDLLSLSKDGDDDNMDERMDSIFGGIRKGLKANSAQFEAVAVKTPVKTVLRRKKKKEYSLIQSWKNCLVLFYCFLFFGI